jgi:hypothetical protein
LITTVWSLAGLLVAVLLMTGIIRVLLLKRSIARILGWLGYTARAHERRRRTARLRPQAPSQPFRASDDRFSVSRRASGAAAAGPKATNPDPQHERRFERLVERYWQLMGYAAISAGPGADGGIDVRIPDKTNTDKTFAVIQCKSWTTGAVGVEPVRALWGAREHFGAELALFYTVYGFTESAKAFAVGKHLKLLDGEALLAQIQRLPDADRQRLLREITEGDYTTPSCPKCASKMQLKKGKEGKSDFWGCPRFPACRAPTITVRTG